MIEENYKLHNKAVLNFIFSGFFYRTKMSDDYNDNFIYQK